MANPANLTINELAANSAINQPTAQAIDTNGTVNCAVKSLTDRLIIEVVNTDDAALTVTVKKGTGVQAHQSRDLAVSLAASGGGATANRIIGPFESSRFVKADGSIDVDFGGNRRTGLFGSCLSLAEASLGGRTMTKWFRRGDGVHFSADEGTPSCQMMETDGAFEEISDPTAKSDKTEKSEETVVEKAVNLQKLNKAQLCALAEEKGVKLSPDEMTKAQIIEAIENAAETAEIESTEPTENK